MFPRIQLSELVTIKGGKRLRPSEEFSTMPTQHPYIRARDVGGGVIKIQDAVYLTETVAQRLSRYRVKMGDVCITIVGANVGEMGIVPAELDGANLTENCVRLTGTGRVTQGFLRYALLSDDAQGQMKVVAGGAAQPKLGIYKIEAVEIPLPLLPTQRKIASILSAYDDLIENNTRRIAILEEMAQAIYREWFVNFRFPGHANAKLVDSALGNIPDGWEVVTLAEIADVNARSVNKWSVPDNINYIDIASVSTGRIDEIRSMPFSESPGRARRIVRHGDVIWSTVRPVRRSYSIILDPLPDTIASTGFAVLSAKTVPFSYVYFATTTDDFATYLVNHATGSAYPAVNGKDFENARVILPRLDILAQFDDAVGDMLLMGHRLLVKNRNLRTTRDLLLPKLVSGQLDVEELDIDLGASAEELKESRA